MSALRSTLLVTALLVGSVGTASAQGFAGGVGVANGFAGGYGGYGGSNSGFYGANRGYGNFGNSGGYYSSYYGGNTFRAAPLTYNNLGGLMNTIRTQTGRPNSYRYGSNYGVSRRRLPR